MGKKLRISYDFLAEKNQNWREKIQKNCTSCFTMVSKEKKFKQKRPECPFRPFLNETAFYAKLSGQFLGPKTKVTKPIASN